MSHLSEIQDFYRGSTIFLTGGTGYVGKLVLEKLLRGCPGIRHIYILVRDKKNVSPGDRLLKLFQCPIFDPLKRNYPKFAEKVSIINGNLLLPNLGLTDQDVELIVRDINIIIHCAATVRFDQKLKEATQINVIATRDLLQIAKRIDGLKTWRLLLWIHCEAREVVSKSVCSMEKFHQVKATTINQLDNFFDQAFVHVSTAYSNCDRKEIDECVYPPKIKAENLIAAVDALDDELLLEMQDKLLGKLPNTYTLTKQVAEDLVRREAQNLPLIIVRPSIIIATMEEPICGFIDNLYGPTGIIIAIGVGFLRVVRYNWSKKADTIPADIVVNQILAAAWHVGTTRKQGEQQDPEVQNCVLSKENPMKWGDYMKYSTKFVEVYPPKMSIWYPFHFMCINIYLHAILHYVLHMVPAHIADNICILMGKKPQLVAAYTKAARMSAAIAFFGLREWNFGDTNRLNMWKEMSFLDKKLFSFDPKTIEWEDYLYLYLKGCRLYLVNETMDTLEEGKRKYKMFKVLHYSFITIFSVLMLYLFMLFFRFILSS